MFTTSIRGVFYILQLLLIIAIFFCNYPVSILILYISSNLQLGCGLQKFRLTTRCCCLQTVSLQALRPIQSKGSKIWAFCSCAIWFHHVAIQGSKKAQKVLIKPDPLSPLWVFGLSIFFSIEHLKELQILSVFSKFNRLLGTTFQIIKKNSMFKSQKRRQNL